MIFAIRKVMTSLKKPGNKKILSKERYFMPSLISECSFVYQPIVTPEKIPVGYEVLTRHPILSPPDIIKKIENENFILEHMVSMFDNIKKRIPNIIPVFLNITPKVLLSKETRSLIKSFSEERPIILELTENSNFIPHKNILKDLKIAYFFDDFLSRHTLDEIAELRPAGLKISNVHTIKYLEEHKDLFRALIQFANSLNMIVIIEGIETKDMFEFCEGEEVLIQGFYVEKPVQMPLLSV